MRRKQINEWEIPLAVEDKFIVFSLGTAGHLLPHVDDAHRLGEMLSKIGKLTPVFDLRNIHELYYDVQDFIRQVAQINSIALVRKEKDSVSSKPAFLIDRLEYTNLNDLIAGDQIQVIEASGKHFSTTVLEHHLFDQDSGWYDNEEEPVNSRRNLRSLRLNSQFRDFREFLSSIQKKSILMEYILSANGKTITINPYHAHAMHCIETSSSDLLIGRPAAIANTTRSVLSNEIHGLERLINDKAVSENAIQKYLEKHPNFLRGLNYQNIYPQLVLERDDQGVLKPDFILEPYEGGFCDILDLKLPNQGLFVGGQDRGRLAAGIQEVAAQLREYAAYFEQDRYRKFVYEKYGIRVYRPRLIAIIGRSIKGMEEPELRRAMTEYQNLQIMTFDELVKHAKNRILI